MSRGSDWWLLSVAILLLTTLSHSTLTIENGVKTQVFLSPKFELEPGFVNYKYYYGIDWPKGHIAIKEFEAELVDEAGNSVPLYETYLHHWLVVRYYQRQGVNSTEFDASGRWPNPDLITTVRNSGICDSNFLQYFGVGAETRKTNSRVPDPYGIVVGNPADLPPGYEEIWMLNVHAIDTRGAEDLLGCTECRCDLYNLTVDEDGRPYEKEYVGGLRCCYDNTRCKVKQGFPSIKRSLYMKYTIKYVDWEPSIVPVRIYIFDVTDTWNKSGDTRHDCKVEYNVETCSTVGCVHTKSITSSFPNGGDVIYGVAHQHIGGIGSTLFGEDGRIICSSLPIYGEGMEAGNEDGYIVGMTTCYPRPGSVKIADGETLTFVSNYSNHHSHTGVMGLFYILVADPLPTSYSIIHAQNKMMMMMIEPNVSWILAMIGIAVCITLYFYMNDSISSVN